MSTPKQYINTPWEQKGEKFLRATEGVKEDLGVKAIFELNFEARQRQEYYRYRKQEVRGKYKFKASV